MSAVGSSTIDVAACLISLKLRFREIPNSAEKRWWVLKRPNLTSTYFKRDAILGLFFFIFVFSIQLMVNKVCRCLDSNHRSLVLEATALPTAPPPLPTCPKYNCFLLCQIKGFRHQIEESKFSENDYLRNRFLTKLYQKLLSHHTDDDDDVDVPCSYAFIKQTF